jgi:glutaredoxin
VLTEKGIPPVILSQSTPAKEALATHLSRTGVVIYTAYWCPHCHEQKELFGKQAAAKLTQVECAADGKNSQATLCESKKIDGFPSWEINGKVDSGVKTLNQLADLSGYKGPRNF